VKHVEATQILDIEKASKVASQFRCGEQMTFFQNFDAL